MSRRALVAGLAAAAFFAGPAAARGELHVSPAGVRMIEHFEGFVATVQPDPVGVPTIGFGTTTADVRPLPARVTRADAERLLTRVLERRYLPPIRALFRGPLRRLYTVARADALASAAYNLGTGVVTCAHGFSSMCAALRERSARRIGAALLLYDHAGGVRLAGLTRRRHAEAAPWLRPIRRFEDFAPVEAHLILSFDRLAGHRSAAARARRELLRHALRARAGHVARVARADRDWLSHRRAVRRDALARRAHNPLTGGLS